MEVILLEDIAKLGHIGDVVKVKDGFARNYLIPQKKAMAANVNNVRALEHQKRVAAKKLAKAKGSADEIKAQLEKLELSFTQKAGEQGKLFGSVTNIMIAEQLAQHGHTIDRHNIQTDVIKATGSFKVPVKLHRDVTAMVKVVVVSDQPAEEAKKPAKAEAEPAPAAE
jgi:large subunit ribosomal protein L9